MRLQGAIFDLDGTLLDSSPVWSHLGEDMLRARGVEPEPNLNDVFKEMSLVQSATYCKEHYHLKESVAEIMSAIDNQVDDYYRNHSTVKPGVKEFLSILKMQSVWMYIVTATNREQTEAALRHTGLEGYFRGILTCTECNTDKTSPVIYEKAVRRLRCRKKDVVVFEDALHAIRTAKNAGFRVAAVEDSASAEDKAEIITLADYYISDFTTWFQEV